jgi:hypothetical protein
MICYHISGLAVLQQLKRNDFRYEVFGRKFDFVCLCMFLQCCIGASFALAAFTTPACFLVGLSWLLSGFRAEFVFGASCLHLVSHPRCGCV